MSTVLRKPFIVVLSILTITLSIGTTENLAKSRSGSGARNYRKACKHIKSHDYISAHQKLKISADKGHGRAQTLLGMLYENGVGVEKNTEQALSYYEKAAMQGIPQAESRLGHLLLSLEKDSEVVSLETASWLKKAAAHGEEEARLTLGRLTLDFKNSPINQNEAVWYLKDAAKKGNNQAKSLLNKMPKPPSSALGNPAQQVSAGVQGLAKSWKGYSDLASSINQAASYKK